MDILNEHSLAHIFKFVTSVQDMAVISQVCTTWRKIMSRFWKRMDVFATDTKIFPKKSQSISIKTLITIIELAGPYINFASLELEDMYVTRIHLGPHLIDLDEFIGSQDLIEILSENSGNISEMEFINCIPEKKNNRMLRSLFQSNSKVKKLRLKDCNLETLFDDDIVLPSVKELELYLHLDVEMKSLRFTNLHKRLPNLFKLETVLRVTLSTYSHVNVALINRFFCQILPDDGKLRILELYCQRKGYHIYPKSLLAFASPAEMKSLTDQIDADIIDNIVELIVTKCANLQKILLSKFVLSRNNIENLRTLPELKTLMTI